MAVAVQVCSFCSLCCLLASSLKVIEIFLWFYFFQSDMATPALANHGSDYLKKEFLEPSLSGDLVACLGVSEESAGSDVAG